MLESYCQIIVLSSNYRILLTIEKVAISAALSLEADRPASRFPLRGPTNPLCTSSPNFNKIWQCNWVSDESTNFPVLFSGLILKIFIHETRYTR